MNNSTTLISKKKVIVSNKCQCSNCGDIIESKHVHDFVTCSCGRIFTDGGHEYIRRGFHHPNDIIDLTIIKEIDLTKQG